MHLRCTVICRTNAILFDHAVTLLDKRSIGFVGPIGGYGFGLIRDISSLMYCQNNIKDNFIRNFGNYENLKYYASKAEDLEIKSICTIVEKYKRELPFFIERIFREHLLYSECEVTLTTSHKSRGLEWSNVMVRNDFVPFFKEEELLFPTGADYDEINLLYVVITRAIHNLRLSPGCSLINFLKVCRSAKTQ